MLIELLRLHAVSFTSMGLVVVVCGPRGRTADAGSKNFPREKDGGASASGKQVFSGFLHSHIPRKSSPVLALFLRAAVRHRGADLHTVIRSSISPRTLGYSYDVIGVNLGLMVLLSGVCRRNSSGGLWIASASRSSCWLHLFAPRSGFYSSRWQRIWPSSASRSL